MKFEDAASIALCLTTAVVGLYAARTSKEAPQLLPPWVEGGRDKYKDEPIVIFGGASSVGQFGKLLRIWTAISKDETDFSFSQP